MNDINLIKMNESTYHCLMKIKMLGYTPNIILDIGAHKGVWYRHCLSIFPNSTYYLFEANDYKELKDIHHTSTYIFNVILNDCNKQVDWYQINNTGDSMFREMTKHYKDILPIKKESKRLDDVIEDKSGLNNIFMKIDVQGAEINILKGSKEILTNTDFILIELPFFGQYNENTPSFLEHVKFLDDIGFIPFDITEIHTLWNFTLQVDLLFINKNHYFNQKVKENS